MWKRAKNNGRSLTGDLLKPWQVAEIKKQYPKITKDEICTAYWEHPNCMMCGGPRLEGGQCVVANTGIAKTKRQACCAVAYLDNLFWDSAKERVKLAITKVPDLGFFTKTIRDEIDAIVWSARLAFTEADNEVRHTDLLGPKYHKEHAIFFVATCYAGVPENEVYLVYSNWRPLIDHALDKVA